MSENHLTGELATWGEGDWDGAPGGSPGTPPPGNGQFDQFDIIAAQQAGVYLTGPYAAVRPGGDAMDSRTSIGDDASTGELAVHVPADIELTSTRIDSASGIFTGEPAANLVGAVDRDADGNIFRGTLGGSLGTIGFGRVAQPGLAEQFLDGDLTVTGSLQGGGRLGEVDLTYVPVPEPSTALLAWIAMVGCGTVTGRRWKRARD